MPSSAQNICIAGEVLDEVVRQALQLFDRVIGAGPANPFSLNNVCQTIAWFDARQHRQAALHIRGKLARDIVGLVARIQSDDVCVTLRVQTQYLARIDLVMKRSLSSPRLMASSRSSLASLPRPTKKHPRRDARAADPPSQAQCPSPELPPYCQHRQKSYARQARHQPPKYCNPHRSLRQPIFAQSARHT